MYKLPDLEYGYSALDGYISEETMKFHHDKHHQAYVDKLNAVLEKNPDLQQLSLEELMAKTKSLPETIREAIRNNGGGHYNHSLFWKCLSPVGDGNPKGKLALLINDKYDDFQSFVDEFTAKSLTVFGSGWTWLQPNGDIITTSNQDTPIAMGLESPILCLDVWEHAYYLDYKNRRDEYIKAWWNVVNWSFVESRFDMAIKS
jgi:Fe-Mn family superoxide dismutase